MADSSQDPPVYRVKEAFAVPGDDGYPRTYATGKLISGGDPLATSHRSLLEPVVDAVEQATAEPGGRRRLRLPSGVTLKQATEPHTGSSHPKENIVPHSLPPEDPNSPASPFAPEQPGAGVVADDVPDDQNPAGGPKAEDVTAAAQKAAAKTPKNSK